MRKSATIEMMNTFKTYLNYCHRDLKRSANSLIFAEYLLSRVEFFSQIAKFNDYFQNQDIYQKILFLLEMIASRPEPSCCNNKSTIIFFSILFFPFYTIAALTCIENNETIQKKWEESAVFHPERDRRTLKELGERLITELRAVWPRGFKVDKAWMCKAPWTFSRSWKVMHRITYKTEHHHHYAK